MSSAALENKLHEVRQKLDCFLREHWDGLERVSASPSAEPPAVATHGSLQGLKTLLLSERYSLLQNQSKRFRPAVASLVAEALGQSLERVLPFAAAIECVHTYSLIHDDLPCMDNDSSRRGLPTNHVVFGETTALLAGDALLTEAFAIVASHFSSDPAVGLEAIRLLACAAGNQGMVAGQAIDMHAKRSELSAQELKTMQDLKTGALIAVAAEGAAVLAFATPEEREQIKIYAQNLGLAFQIADDLLDFDEAQPETGSYATRLGVRGARAFLADVSAQSLGVLSGWSVRAQGLRDLVHYNQTRAN